MIGSELAIFVSIVSLIIAIASFIWNVWSKFIYPKPRIRVYASVMSVYSGEIEDEILVVSAVNFGPIEATIRCCGVKIIDEDGREKTALMNPLDMYPLQKRQTIGPFGGGLPKKLSVGEEFSLYFHYGSNVKFIDKWVDCYFLSDTFGTMHRSSKKDAQRIFDKFEADKANGFRFQN
ncbi:hypothetical protein [Stappia indica]|uniref:Uncharacterized protein n=1 Tax=Stappia indica TaxID=538381 RepID=A0A857CCK4_9HYPH|nr:hypothetical protein [Stappia indica]QGZ36585.1 hypothetical protein GH266_20100 [Stappia indica]